MKRLLYLLTLVSVLGAGCVSVPQQNLGTAEDGSQWQVFSAFNGYQTKLDPEKVPDGANPQGQNTTANHGDRISIRDTGYNLFPASAFFSTTSTGVISLHTFRRRDGGSILMRSTSSTLEWYDHNGTSWETLNSGYQNGDFGYADNNVNTDQKSYVYFGNSKDAFSRWTGAHTALTVAAVSGGGSITVSDTSDFPATGTIIYCGSSMTYSAKTATSFTVVSAVDCANGKGVAEAVETFSDQTLYPRGNIYMFADNRLWLSGTTSTPNIVYFSGYGTSTQFSLTSLVTSSTAASPGLFSLAEGGGRVTAMVQDEGSEYVFKPSIIYRISLTDTIYSLAPLKAFDGRSQTTGARSKSDVFVTANGVFFITPDNQIMLLDRVDYIDYPQITAISDIIKPTVDSLVFASSTGIVFQNKAYFSVKSTADAPTNDVVLVYNLIDKLWDSPIIGWNASDWAVYQDSDHEELYFGDGTTDNVYRVTSQPLDYQYNTVANWRSKQYTFGSPQALKYVSNVFVEGYIAPNTSLTISLLLDEDGFTKRYSTTFAGTESTYIYNSSLYNVFGFKPFGTTRFGSQEDLTGKKKFRIYLGKDFQQVPAYNAQLEFASDGQNSAWEVDNFGFLVRQAPVPEKASLYHSFK